MRKRFIVITVVIVATFGLGVRIDVNEAVAVDGRWDPLHFHHRGGVFHDFDDIDGAPVRAMVSWGFVFWAEHLRKWGDGEEETHYVRRLFGDLVKEHWILSRVMRIVWGDIAANQSIEELHALIERLH